jgi:orotate phosphoribosyltransferase
MKDVLIRTLREKKILKYGVFTLRSGQRSSYYCDIKEALGHPKILSKIIKELVLLVPHTATCIAGSGYGGITLASLVAFKMSLPLVLVRERVKDHGTKKMVDAYVPGRKDTVCVIDDVFTTGGSIQETKEKLRVLGVKFCQPVVVLNRSKRKTVRSILQDTDLTPLRSL